MYKTRGQALAMSPIDTKPSSHAALAAARDHLNSDVWELALVADELARLSSEHHLLTAESLSATPAHLSLLEDTVQKCHTAIADISALESRAEHLLAQSASHSLNQIGTQLYPRLKQLVAQITQVTKQEKYYSLVRDVLLAQQAQGEPSIESCLHLEALVQRAKNLPEQLGMPEDDDLVELAMHLRDAQQAKLLAATLEHLDQMLAKHGWPMTAVQPVGAAADELRELLRQVAQISQDKCLAALITPIATRFAYHFLGDRPTNQLARPDWYTGYLRKVALTQAPFAATLHSIVPVRRWISALTSLATDKLVTDWPDLLDPTPNLGLAARTWMVVGGLVEELEVVMRAAGVDEEDEQRHGWKVPDELMPGMAQLVKGMIQQVLEDTVAMEWELPEDEWVEEGDGEEGEGEGGSSGVRLTKAAAKWGQYWQLLLDIPAKLTPDSATHFVKQILAESIEFAIDQLVALFRRAPSSDFALQFRIACTTHALAYQVQDWALTLATDPILLSPHLSNSLSTTVATLLDTSAHRLSTTILLSAFRDAHVPLPTALTLNLHVARTHLPRGLYKRWWTKFRAHFDRDCVALMLAGRLPPATLPHGAGASVMAAVAAAATAAPGGMLHPCTRAEINRVATTVLASTLVQFAPRPASPAAAAGAVTAMFPRMAQAKHLVSLSRAQRGELRLVVDEMMQEVGWASGANAGEWQLRASGWRVGELGVAEVAAALDAWVGEEDGCREADEGDERDEFR